MDHSRVITMDSESRSEQDIGVGPTKYFDHPSTELLCWAFALGDDEEVGLWNMATEGIEQSPDPTELFRRIEDGWLVEAHNVMFERRGWARMMRRYGWPAIRRDQWRCSAAKAAYHCLPRGLEDLAVVLRLSEQKDPVGKELIKALSKPRKILKREWNAHLKACVWAEENFEATPPAPKIWNEDPVLIRRNWAYCQQDVRTERAASRALPDMPASELAVWQMDQEMNFRGVQCDLEMARSAIEVAQGEVGDLNGRLAQIVPGVEKATQRAKVKAWLTHPDRVPWMPDTTADTVDKMLRRKLPGDEMAGTKVVIPGESRQVLEIVRKVNKSSLAKYQAMLDVAIEDPDDPSTGRLHDLLMYAGAHTQRWTAKNVQPHNFPRGGIKHIDTAADVIKTRDRDWARFLYGDVMELLSHSLRGALISGRGKRLWVADFAAIEARVVFWLAQCAAALAVFERGDDIYCDMASRIYGRTITKSDASERQMGKQSILGLGFGMGFVKFLMTLRKYNISFTKDQVRAIVGDDECRRIMEWLRRRDKFGGWQYVTRGGMGEKDLVELVLTKFVVDLYRNDYPEIPAFWKQQETAAIHCVEGGKLVTAGLITWEVQGRRLVAHLPSGRVQTYWDPFVGFEPVDPDDYGPTDDAWVKFKRQKGVGDSVRVPRDLGFMAKLDFELWLEKNTKRRKKLEYHGLDQKTKVWTAHGTYGGELTENLVQHIARDIMAEAMLRIEESPTYQNILSVHDEEIAESGVDEGNAEEFRELIIRPSAWSEGCPIDAEVAKIIHRYKKG